MPIVGAKKPCQYAFFMATFFCGHLLQLWAIVWGRIDGWGAYAGGYVLKFQFNSQMPHQQKAIQAVVDLFKGQQQGFFQLQGLHAHGQLSLFAGQGNAVSLSDEQLLSNAQHIQQQNGLDVSKSLPSRNFSIEMETGTGKTYVYIKSILELNKQYGFKKFIIVVPSLAIRAGVIKSFQIMKDHLDLQYGNLPEPIVYNSKRLSRVRAFKNSADLQIMIMNIQTFQKDTARSSNVIHRNDDLMGGRPIEFIQAVRPVVIVDEPQSVDSTEKSQAALAKLEPSVILRYSATHKHKHTLLYQLGPVQAYNQGLVKSIEVASVCDGDSKAYVEYVKGDNTQGKIKACVKFYKKTKSGDKVTQAWLKQHNDLYDKSNQHPAYKKGYVINNIDTAPTGYIELSRGQRIQLGSAIRPRENELVEAMLRETIEQHFQKELALKNKGIKVLSLFFIDRVNDYRQHLKSGAYQLGPLAQKFERIYSEVSAKYKDVLPFKACDVHNGYFSKDKKGLYKDTKGLTQDDVSTYNLIMRDKEKLLDPAEPLRFIFSHTALKEGWDNPNVFQLCTLRSVASQMQRRQQIGRGLRLPVDIYGQRVVDEHINRLTVVSSEDYSQYAVGLQTEYEQECGVKFKTPLPIANAKQRTKVKLNEPSHLNADFKKLWDKIKARTRYRAFFTSCAQDLSQCIYAMPPVQSLQLSVTKARLDLSMQGIRAEAQSTPQLKKKLVAQAFPNPVAALSQAVPLTRATLAKALLQSQRLDDFIKNPYDFIDKATFEVKKYVAALVLKGIKYEKAGGEIWQMTRFQDEDNKTIRHYEDKIYRIKNHHKSLYNGVIFDSEVEKRMAQDLDANEHIKFFIKLPNWFKIDTPLGAYNPDWAFVSQREEKLYFVRETKSTLDTDNWRKTEEQKVDCGRKHFKSIGVDFDVVTRLDEVKI